MDPEPNAVGSARVRSQGTPTASKNLTKRNDSTRLEAVTDLKERILGAIQTLRDYVLGGGGGGLPMAYEPLRKMGKSTYERGGGVQK